MSQESPNSNLESFQKALITIKALEQQVLQEGNVDDEINQLEEIIKKLTSHEIEPREAIIKAEEIINKRQNYH
ncbi:MAG: hypothetical protein KGI58_01925 [Patescibacteria group bacterium]|nr:hypothetical protein [Patescibacteria group bacterium]